MSPPLCLSTVPVDLSPEERSELEEIRRRKGALLLEIQRLKEELREAIIEVEGLESSTEGRLVSHLPVLLTGTGLCFWLLHQCLFSNLPSLIDNTQIKAHRRYLFPDKSNSSPIETITEIPMVSIKIPLAFSSITSTKLIFPIRFNNPPIESITYQLTSL